VKPGPALIEGIEVGAATYIAQSPAPLA